MPKIAKHHQIFNMTQYNLVSMKAFCNLKYFILFCRISGYFTINMSYQQTVSIVIFNLVFFHLNYIVDYSCVLGIINSWIFINIDYCLTFNTVQLIWHNAEGCYHNARTGLGQHIRCFLLYFFYYFWICIYLCHRIEWKARRIYLPRLN